jgi:class 3 adenylate cyclase
MTIRARLVLSFIAILFLLSLNIGVYSLGGKRRNASFEALRRALELEVQIASVKQSLNDVEKQLALSMSQMAEETPEGGVGAEELSRFSAQLDAIDGSLKEIRDLSDPRSLDEISRFWETFRELSASWKIVYRNLGVDQTRVITESALHADPLSARLMKQLLPEVERNEKARVEEAREDFHHISVLISRWIYLLFGISALVSVTVAWRVSRDITREIAFLRDGARRLGEGELDHRIDVGSKNELAALARSFNDMAANLLRSRDETTRANQDLEQRNREVERQREVSQSLLENILPVQIARELADKGSVAPRYFEDVTVLFSDFEGFSLSTERMAAEDVVARLDDYFTTFDAIVARYGIEKLKTVGDSYMCVAGLPERRPSHAVDMLLAAFEMVRAVADRTSPDQPLPWHVRIGIHTGPVIAGVVGTRKFAFDIWGDTVNYASRMESHGAPGRINVSARTYSRVKDFFECEPRGRIMLAKEKKEMEMYFASGVLPALLEDISQSPPPAFARRYRVYFQKDPPSFPSFFAGGAPEGHGADETQVRLRLREDDAHGAIRDPK